MSDKENILVFPAGSVIAFSSGEYSDYSYCGTVVTLKQCDLIELGKVYKEKHIPEYDWQDSPSPEGFSSWLVVNGYAMPVQWQEVHCGCYGRFELC